jgi:hypothetical protein
MDYLLFVLNIPEKTKLVSQDTSKKFVNFVLGNELSQFLAVAVCGTLNRFYFTGFKLKVKPELPI